MNERVPVTVIGGFLGAGKTTLVNTLLRHAGGRHIAVLVNDFGAIGIDADLIASQDGDTISLTNGCICCSFSSGLAEAMLSVRDRVVQPDHVVIEASGVGDPYKIAQYGTTPGFRLDGTVVLVDVTGIRELADDPTLGAQVLTQLRRPDLLVLTKVDLLDDPGDVVDVTSWLDGVSGGAPVVVGPLGSDSVDVLLSDLVSTRPAPAPSVRSDNEGDHAGCFETRSYVHRGLVSAADWTDLGACLAGTVLRAKGIATVDDGSTSALHVVGRRHRVERIEPVAGNEPDARLVVIGVSDTLDAAAAIIDAAGFVASELR